MAAIIPAVFLAVTALNGSVARAGLPPPSAQAADIRVDGDASALVRIDIAGPADDPPPLLRTSKIRSVREFSWWTSRHFALRTDYPADRARFYLELLEMAYPHYVTMHGPEPRGSDTGRLAVTYGATRESMLRAMSADLGYDWDFEGGGITLDEYFCAYAYPSGGLDYHQRYIVLHECAHLYKQVLHGTPWALPGWADEGASDSVAHHVFDAANRVLRVHVLDKATTHNHLDEGLTEFGHPPASLEKMVRAGGMGRGSCFLAFQYFHRDAGRRRSYAAWRDEVARMDPKDPERDRKAAELLGKRFGGWRALNSGFSSWLGRLKNTFHYVTWGWEQDGDVLWSKPNFDQYAQTDVNLPPGGKAVRSPLRLDYPPAPPSPLVGPVKRGGREPSVGFLLDISRSPDEGQAGIGLGTVSDVHPVPFGRGSLFADRNGRIPGMTVTVWKLGPVRNGGTLWEDLALSATVAGGVEDGISVGRNGSLTGKPGEDFAVEWAGWFRAPASGLYSFALGSDDGSWLSLGDRLVVDNGGYHAFRLAKGSVRLRKGLHPVTVRFFQGKGARALSAGFAPPLMPGSLKVLIEEGRRLIIDGADLGCGTVYEDLPESLRTAVRTGGNRLGITVTVGAKRLLVTLRAGPESMAASLPLTAGARTRLLRRPLCVLAREGEFGITPFFDDGRPRPGK